MASGLRKFPKEHKVFKKATYVHAQTNEAMTDKKKTNEAILSKKKTNEAIHTWILVSPLLERSTTAKNNPSE